MAYVKVGSHGSATACLTYGEYKDGQQREGVVVGGVDCRPSAAKEEFKAVRFLWNKENGVQAHTVIQSFDDKFVFYGSKVRIRKQIGNAVPPLMAKAIADTIYNELTK